MGAEANGKAGVEEVVIVIHALCVIGEVPQSGVLCGESQGMLVVVWNYAQEDVKTLVWVDDLSLCGVFYAGSLSETFYI